MGIIYIGDRNVGKTHLATELGNPNNKYIKVNTPYYNSKPQPTDAQNSLYGKTLELEVKLPSGQKKLTLNWIDTPGEIWRKHWQQEKQIQWQNFITAIQQTDGILLVLPPYRQIINPNLDNQENYITEKQWCNRFQRWVEFFSYQCPQIRHLLLCLNKADLFCQYQQEGEKLAYLPYNSPLNWQQKNIYVMRKYFYPIYPQIQQLNQNINGLSVRCFITSIYNRNLLELPWIYLASFLT